MRTKLIGLLVLVASSLSFSYTYTNWTTMTGAKTIAVAPTIWGGAIDGLGSSTLDLNTAFGFGDKVDVVLNLSKFEPLSDFTWAGIEVMPRYALTDNFVLALKLGTDFEALELSPQIHLCKELDKIVLELNAAIDLSTASDFKEGYIWASHGVVYKMIPDIFYPFIEFNPYVSYGYFETEVNFSIDPGFWFGVKDTPHQFSLSLPISGFKSGETISVGLNAWYWWSFEY
ncbi:MAG: hypothetical protein JNL74_06340 [Fibrobacteres bacterium]|nr:hypothetical protein [Fibrobacterota bacterium]